MRPGEIVAKLLMPLLLSLAITGTGATAAQRSGGWRLAQESSPYLRMHAGNPVEWFPWGEEAFARARRENKPLFISIGYFTCHWCHVMARESFSNPEVAALLNAGFVSIKIDREQRPDLDDAYMKFVTATRGQGGWPMTVWATPGGKPFFGGTYFPPQDAGGHAGMGRILTAIRSAWQEDPEALQRSADNAVRQLQKLAASARPLDTLTNTQLAGARAQYSSEYDELSGGFGVAPKFPQAPRLLFLLQDAEPAAAGMALHTLDAMAAGGIHDQLGGGFHRYATDGEWRVPHFEMMLYDQALIARAYLLAWRRTGKEEYAVTAHRVLDFALDNMHDPAGGFYSALGADSPVAGAPAEDLAEGAFYVWTWRQFSVALQDTGLLEWAAARYGVTRDGESRGDLAGGNVLHVALDEQALAQRFGVDRLVARKRNAMVDERLRQARNKRPAVPVDDKVVAAWNGYMITTLALAGRMLDETRYIEEAARTARFILDGLYDDKGMLHRDWRKGKLGVPAFGGDYAALAEGLLALYRVTGERLWLDGAQRLVDTLLAGFRDEEAGGFYTTANGSRLWVREKTVIDDATLSVNGIAVHVLLDLGAVTGHAGYIDEAVRTAKWAGAQLADAPAWMPYTLIKWPELQRASRPEEKAQNGS